MRSLLDQLPRSVRSINVSGNAIGDPAEPYVYLLLRRNLQKLYLRNCGLTKASCYILTRCGVVSERGPHQTALQLLDLGENGLGIWDWGVFFEGMATDTELKWHSISPVADVNKVSSHVMTAAFKAKPEDLLLDFFKIPMLQTLYLDGNSLNTSHVLTLMREVAAPNVQLRHLHIGDNDFKGGRDGDEVVGRLVEWLTIRTPSLCTLGLRNLNLRGEEGRSLASFLSRETVSFAHLNQLVIGQENLGIEANQLIIAALDVAVAKGRLPKLISTGGAIERVTEPGQAPYGALLKQVKSLMPDKLSYAFIMAAIDKFPVELQLDVLSGGGMSRFGRLLWNPKAAWEAPIFIDLPPLHRFKSGLVFRKFFCSPDLVLQMEEVGVPPELRLSNRGVKLVQFAGKGAVDMLLEHHVINVIAEKFDGSIREMGNGSVETRLLRDCEEKFFGASRLIKQYLCSEALLAEFAYHYGLQKLWRRTPVEVKSSFEADSGGNTLFAKLGRRYLLAVQEDLANAAEFESLLRSIFSPTNIPYIDAVSANQKAVYFHALERDAEKAKKEAAQKAHREASRGKKRNAAEAGVTNNS